MLAARIIELARIVGGLSRSRAREWSEWAAENPLAASIFALRWAHVAEHRSAVLKGRRWAFRKAHRVRRWLSIATELREWAEELMQVASKPTLCKEE